MTAPGGGDAAPSPPVRAGLEGRYLNYKRLQVAELNGGFRDLGQVISILLNEDNRIAATNYGEIYLFSHAQIYIRFLF